MSSETSNTIRVESGNLIGSFWFIGWLFTIAFAELTFWQSVLGILVWPYFLGLAAR